MTLLLSVNALRIRSQIAGGPLGELAGSLAADLSAVIERPLYVPEQKAMLSREGGRCARDGTMLDFDPFSPHSHICPRCGTVYTGELHDRFWIYWYQLWLAERAVHGAVLGALGVEGRGIDFALSVLDAYADRYLTYPNVDNALGPTRPFFSTYLESIWLLQLCVALDLIESSPDAAKARRIGARVRERVIEPSRALIHTYDEGMSNRQVWNNAAMMAASRLLGRDDQAGEAVWSESGVAMHLDQALLPDGTWYEGENYHLFAHRGLWYAVTMAEEAGIELPIVLSDRFNDGFTTPFLTALPDFTLPSRRDSQYAISLRQWRFAEMCELGLARRDDRILSTALTRLYRPDIPRTDTSRRRSSAEAERNSAPTALTRADLNWKSLLFARPELPRDESAPLPSVLLEAQGIGVLRRDAGQVYVALDYGHSGGGHGHPDRLNLLLMQGSIRWLDDFGTGSYVDPSLHWYRSTLAHNAPLIDGRSQQRVTGTLEAFEDRGAAGWMSATAAIAPGATVTRTIVAMPQYLVDEVRWTARGAGSLDLPLHVDATLLNAPPSVSEPLLGSDGSEDGFRFLHDTARIATVAAEEVIQLRSARDGRVVDLWISSDSPIELWKAIALAAPGRGEAPFVIIRSASPTGTLRAVWSWNGDVQSATLFPAITVQNRDERHEHSRVSDGWRIAMVVGGGRSTIDLERSRGGVVSSRASAAEDDEEPRRAVVLKPNRPVRVRLGGESYRQSEQTWREAGEPTVEIAFANANGSLTIEIEASKVDRTFAKPGADNRLDNENADVNGAGIQLYLRTDDASAGYVIVPRVPGPAVGIRAIDGWGAGIPIAGTWTESDAGYVLEIRTPELPNGTVIDVDVIINEKPWNRERRRGQLVLSGGAGEFVYLRGDRHDADRLIPMLLTDA